MATCAECVHVEVCKDFISSLLEGLELDKSDVELINKELNQDDADKGACDHFLDRARVAALPCVGDKVYELCRINQFGDYKIDESEIKGFIVDTDGTAFDYELLGKRFFLTPEAAEQAEKERENKKKNS